MTKATIETIGFHGRNDVSTKTYGGLAQKQDVAFTYTFENFFHPFVGELIGKVNQASLPGMLDPKYHERLKTPFFDDFYTALTDFVEVNRFPKEIDLRPGGPYANYNWELLFHIPFTVAVHLSKSQRFAEAQRWFHYIFNPTDPEKIYWNFLAFRRGKDVTQIGELLALLSKPNPSEAEALLRESILNGYEAIMDKPFQPHAVARTRHGTYMYAVVMKYLDNLIAWGDSLFRQDTIESINEAIQRYVLAANLLGPRPQRIPRQGTSRPRTFAELKQQGPDKIGNALVDLEGKFPFNLGAASTQDADPDAAGPLFGIGRTLYFCIPRNEKLLSYWDTVADRLFKIRNCMNIEGIVRQLALFEPALDPGMLVKAAAAGIDLSSMAGGLHQPISPVRSLFLIHKALELSAEVRGLGSALLSAIEKGDSERMALLRQGHEIKIQQMMQDVRFLQWKQAQESTESLLRSRASALERYRYYQRLLDIEPDDEATPEDLPLDRRELTEENFDEAFAVLVDRYASAVPEEDFSTLRRVIPEGASHALGFLLQSGNLQLSFHEFLELNVLGPAAQVFRTLASTTDTTTAAVTLLPDAYVDAQPMGVGGHARVGGGEKTAKSMETASSAFNKLATISEAAGSYASKVAGYQRRADEWILQHNLAGGELVQIGRQILGSLIAEQIAHHEYLNVQKQIEQSQEVDRFLREKFSNAELYAWMQGETARLYYEYYRFAFDTARKAEQTMKHELMRPEVDATDFVKFNYWDGGRKGLLSGEALYLDLKRMEMAYHENYKREHEITKDVSLRQLDPGALLKLKATGSCEVTLPEWLFDLDAPGHYLRRIKNVRLSIPSVTGPFTSVNCTLTLLKSTVRRSPQVNGQGYARQQDSEDSRFVDSYVVQSIVTSTGNNDSGMFETNLRDERFLPFEGHGAISTWRLELPVEFRQFDYHTISDVVLHMSYTARPGGSSLGKEARKHVHTLVEGIDESDLVQLFSLRHDFPNEWHRFVTGDENFVATIKKEHFPYLVQGKEIKINGLELYVLGDAGLQPSDVSTDDLTGGLQDDNQAEISLTEDTGLVRDRNGQAFLVVRYSIPRPPT